MSHQRFAGFADLFHNISRAIVPLLFFLVPLTFLPWTTEVLEVNKQAVLVVLATVAVVAWLGGMVFDRRLSLRGGIMVNIAPFAFAILALASAAFSEAGYETWLGINMQHYTSVLTLIALVLLYYVTVNTGSVSIGRYSLLAFLASALLAGIIGLFGLFGVQVLPFAFAGNAGFNTVGTVNALASLLTVATLTGLAMFLTTDEGEGAILPTGTIGLVAKVLIGVVAAVTLFVLVAIDFWGLWLIFLGGLIALVSIALLEPRHFPDMKRFALPGVLALVAILFLFVKTPLKLNIPVVVSPSLATSQQIAVKALSEQPMGLRALIGTGPGTFAYQYAQYKPIEVNASPFWAVSFDRAQSHALTVLTTMGVLGALAWAWTFIAAGIAGFMRVVKDKQEADWKVGYALLVGWISLFASHLLFSSNMTLTFLLWTISGLLVAHAVIKKQEMDFSDSPKLALGVTAGFGLSTLGIVLALLFFFGRYSADMAFAKAVRMDAEGAPVTEIIAQVQKAIDRSGGNALYHRNKASVLLAYAGQIIGSANGAELTEEQTQLLSGVVTEAVNAAVKATEVAPNDASNWAARGAVYRQLMMFAQNAEDFAAVSYLQAIALEPTNPAYATELGRVYLSVAERAAVVKNRTDVEQSVKDEAIRKEAELLVQAEKILGAAVQLKGDYAPAHYYLAAVYERQGRLEESAARLSALKEVAPLDIGLGFQLGIMYIKLQKLDLARAEFERVLTIYPDYSNAMWYLAAIEVQAGKTQEALQLLNKVLELNPENAAIQKAIADVTSGTVTPAATIAPVEASGTPIENDLGV